ncbi:MAG: hypothetical protein QOH85_601 [Acidobacteriaceae bacterium]|jgi:hypothetical protein|nr:hypothetical protein [Acidobacteriaceae bacterium]
MTTTGIFQSRLGTHHGSADPDPLLMNEEFTHRATFRVLGFAVEIASNAGELLLAAGESWGEQIPATASPAVKVRLGVKQSKSTKCPPAPSVRTHDHLLSMIANADNFLICDQRQSTAFGWVNTVALRNRKYLRYHFLEAAAMCLLSTSQVTPIHAACVSFGRCGFLFCGSSGAGKSTLAYGCARAGWTYTSDDASYLLWNSSKQRMVRGNSQQVRFRPSAKDLFPEIHGWELTPRAVGKPSIEIPTAELAGIKSSTDSQVHFIIVLDRHESGCAKVTPLVPEAVIPLFESSLYPFEEIWKPQVNAVQQLLTAKMYTLRYSGLTEAVQRLEQLAQGDPLQ